VIALWLSTFLIQVPLHETLSSEWSEETIRELIHSNWIRTTLWTLRLAYLIAIVLRFKADWEGRTAGIEALTKKPAPTRGAGGSIR
jgi:hypothetical protein